MAGVVGVDQAVPAAVVGHGVVGRAVEQGVVGGAVEQGVAGGVVLATATVVVVVVEQ